MTRRILPVALCGALFGVSSLAAQQAALRPHPSSLFMPPPVVATDAQRLQPTYWKEGAIIGGGVLGALGAYAARGLCEMDDSADPCDPSMAAIGGAVIGFFLGAVPGALIGGQFRKKE